MQFKDIKGQYVIANSLTKIIDSGRISHAQLFLGDTVSGSLALAIAYAQYLNCTNRQHYGDGNDGSLRADSCGECPNCKKYQQLLHSDLHLYFPTTTTSSVKSSPSSAEFQSEFREFLDHFNQRGSLDDWYEFMGVESKQGMIRERDADDLVKTLALKAYEGSYKVVIVWMADKMNGVMANKILKNLEEPLPGTLILLVAESRDRMLSTILSRTQLCRIPRSDGDGVLWAGEMALRKEWEQEFAQLYVTWMRQLFKLNMASLSAWVDDLASKGREQQKAFLLYAQEATRECFLRNNAGLPPALDFGDEKFNMSFHKMITIHNVERLNNAFNETIRAIERNAHAKIALMELSFSISRALKKNAG